MAIPSNNRLLATVFVLLSILGYFMTEVQAELCVYKKSVYNIYTSSYDKRLSSMECQWGCCHHHNSPCCSAPISLIVGCVIGGVILFSILIVSICCCVFCRRSINQETQNRNASMRFSITRDPASNVTNQTSISIPSETNPSPQTLPTLMDDHPPSYDEVMRGETNEGFKPDSL